MLHRRNGIEPRLSDTARIAPSAQIVGNVTIGPNCYVDHNAVIESAGPSIVLDAEVLVMANAVIRSVGGSGRPPFAVRIGARTLISPLCALVGCDVGSDCYIATGAMVFHGAVIGDGSRISVGAVVHTKAHLPAGSHVGLRGFAVQGSDGAAMITYDVESARTLLAASDFFGTAFGGDAETALDRLRHEVATWRDEPIR